MISIIIPTLNEEDYLPSLLKSIKEQNFVDYEIIVADAGSNDRTLQIAKEYECKIVPGGLPAKGRNNGAKVAKGEILLFLDADIMLPSPNFLEDCLSEIKKRNLKIAGLPLKANSKNILSRLYLNIFYNRFIIFTERLSAHAAMAIFIAKKLFDDIGGFDESIKLAEDHDMAQRAAKKEKFGIIRSQKILVSDRRFVKDGWIKTGIKYLLCELYILLIGPIKSDIFKYKFNHYKDTK